MSNDTLKEMLTKELELDRLTSAEQEQIISQLGESLMQKAVIAVLDKLPEDKRKEFGALTESGSQQEVYNFLQTNVVNADSVISDEKHCGRYQYSLLLWKQQSWLTGSCTQTRHIKGCSILSKTNTQKVYSVT